MQAREMNAPIDYKASDTKRMKILSVALAHLLEAWARKLSPFTKKVNYSNLTKCRSAVAPDYHYYHQSPSHSSSMTENHSPDISLLPLEGEEGIRFFFYSQHGSSSSPWENFFSFLIIIILICFVDLYAFGRKMVCGIRMSRTMTGKLFKSCSVLENLPSCEKNLDSRAVSSTGFDYRHQKAHAHIWKSSRMV